MQVLLPRHQQTNVCVPLVELRLLPSLLSAITAERLYRAPSRSMRPLHEEVQWSPSPWEVRRRYELIQQMVAMLKWYSS